MLLHPIGQMLTGFDFRIFLLAGRHAVDHPALVYGWKFARAVRFVYPPFAALVFAAVLVLPTPAAHDLMTLASFAATPVTVWLTLGQMGLRGRTKLITALATSAVAIWMWPVVWSLHLGQVEPLLMLLVVWDLSRPDRRPLKGAGIGLAAGIKLVPLIFIPYLLLARKFRQAAVAAGTFAVTIALGFIVLPGPSTRWWLTGYMFNTSKNGSVVSLVDQSLLGLLTRADGGNLAAAKPVWLVLAAVVGAAGVLTAAALARSGRPAHGMVACAFTGLLVSPISWDNHWVWVVPLLALLAGSAARAAGRVRVASLAAAAIVTVAFGAWPDHLRGRAALLPQRAFLGWFSTKGPGTDFMALHLHGAEMLPWNLYVLVGVAVLAVLVGSAVAARAQRQPAPEQPAQKQPVEADPQPAPPAQAGSASTGSDGTGSDGTGSASTGLAGDPVARWPAN
ncbi:MAG: glycosyltransferase 87 family protein [Streptosporangiaceae bacterium]